MIATKIVLYMDESEKFLHVSHALYRFTEILSTFARSFNGPLSPRERERERERERGGGGKERKIFLVFFFDINANYFSLARKPSVRY